MTHGTLHFAFLIVALVFFFAAAMPMVGEPYHYRLQSFGLAFLTLSFLVV